MQSYPKEYISHLVPPLAVVINQAISNDPAQAFNDRIKNKVAEVLERTNKESSLWDYKTSFSILPIKDLSYLPRKPLANQSLLSPLNFGSSLHADGLMTPLWIDRHTKEFPAVTALFLIMGSLDLNATSKELDEITIAHVDHAKTSARLSGSKFIVIFIFKGKPSSKNIIKERLLLFQKSCLLEKTQIQHIIVRNEQSLDQIYEPMEKIQLQLLETSKSYYKDHEKRLKKKKAKLIAGSLKSSISAEKNLSPRGWLFRLEFKLAVFAEFRFELEVCVKHFQNAYVILLEIMNQSVSAGILAANGKMGSIEIEPFSKRWLEARVLLDSISIRIILLLFRGNMYVDGLHQFRKHILNCKDFPEMAYQSLSLEHYSLQVLPGLGPLANLLGGGSFSYWEWVSLQYKIFGELVETACDKKVGFELPIPSLGSVASAGLSLLNTVATTGTNLMNNGKLATVFGPYSSVNQVFTLQHAGFYYLISARAAEERWKRYQHSHSSSPPKTPTPFTDALELESKFDHGQDVIDTLTKSYESFKKLKGVRSTLFLASEIARIYQDMGNLDMAFKFYNRIANTYRNEHWYELLAVTCHRMKVCAQELKQSPVLIECCLELIGLHSKDSYRLIENVCEVIKAEKTETEVNMGMIVSFLEVDFMFKEIEGQVGHVQYFQVSVCSKVNLSLYGLDVDEVIVVFSNPELNYHIVNSGQAADAFNDCKTETIDSKLGAKSNLNFIANHKHIFQGYLEPKSSQELEAVSIICKLKSSIYLKCNLSDQVLNKPKWTTFEHGRLKSIKNLHKHDYRKTRIEQRKPNIDLDLKASKCYLDEYVDFELKGLSKEKEAITLFIELKSIVDQDSDSLDCYFSHNSVSTQSVIHFEYILQNNQIDTSVQIMSTSAKERMIVVSIYVQLNSQEMKIEKVSEGTFDLSDARLLWKRFPPVKFECKQLFGIETNFERRVPELLHSSECGPLVEYERCSGLLKKHTWIGQLSITCVDKVFIEGIEFVKTNEVKAQNVNETKGMQCEKNHTEHLTFLFEIEMDIFSPQTSFELGQLEISWKRDSKTKTIIEIPKIEIENEVLRITTGIPSRIKVYQPFFVEYRIQNMTLHLAELFAFVESSETFVFSGYKQTSFKVLPLGSKTLGFNLSSSQTGRFALPVLRVMKKSDAAGLQETSTGYHLLKEDLEKCFAVTVGVGHLGKGEDGAIMVVVDP